MRFVNAITAWAVVLAILVVGPVVLFFWQRAQAVAKAGESLAKEYEDMFLATDGPMEPKEVFIQRRLADIRRDWTRRNWIYYAVVPVLSIILVVWVAAL